MLDQLNLPALMRAAAAVDGIIELTVAPGDTIREGAVVARIRNGHGDVDSAGIMGPSGSPAVNDRATTVQVWRRRLISVRNPED